MKMDFILEFYFFIKKKMIFMAFGSVPTYRCWILRACTCPLWFFCDKSILAGEENPLEVKREGSLEVVTMSSWRFAVNGRQGGGNPDRKKGGREWGEVEDLPCARARVQEARLQIRGYSWSFSLKLLQENVKFGGFSSLSTGQVCLCWLSEYPAEGSDGEGGGGEGRGEGSLVGEEGKVREHDKVCSFLRGHKNPLTGALRAILQKPDCSKTTCHK